MRFFAGMYFQYDHDRLDYRSVVVLASRSGDTRPIVGVRRERRPLEV